jgi:hypothetical protein
MDRYKLASKLSRQLGLGTAVLLAKFASDWATQAKLHPTSVVIFMLIAAGLGKSSAESLFDLLFLRACWIRRLLLGNCFVEGTWIEFVRMERKPFSISITHISPKNDFSLIFSGTNYDLQGIQLSNFRTDMTEISWPVISCKHSNQPSQGGSPRLEGFGELQFDTTEKLPNTYSGFFIHLTEGRRYNVVAHKITNKESLAKLNSVRDRMEMILASATDFSPA